MGTLTVLDIVILVLYFVLVMAVGLYATVKANRGNAEGFFLAEKSMTFIPIAGSIYASNIGAPMFVGIAGSAASYGFAPVWFEWHAVYILIALGWVFIPIYIASATYTMPQYLQKRFGGKRLRLYYSVTLLVLSVVNNISGEIYAGSIFMQVLLGWNIYLSTAVILAITAVYTIGGGLAAVIYTDTLQAGVLILGATIVSALTLYQVGGYDSLMGQFLGSAARETYYRQSLYGNGTCGFPPSDSFHIFRSTDSDYPWIGLVFGQTLNALFYWCAQQVIVQRTLASKTLTHGKAACVVAGYLKILPFFFFVWPGMASRVLFPDDVACSTPESCQRICNNAAGCTDTAYPYLVLRILPTGLRGLMVAAMLAALMSSLTSQYNSSSSLFTLDIWLHFRKKASQFETVLVGRIFGLLLICVSLAWLPVLQKIQGGNLWDYLQAVSSYITPPWVVAFLLGVFWSRTTEKGVWWGLMAGLGTGIIRMALEFSYPVPRCGSGQPDTRPNILAKVHYLVFSIILAAVSLVVMVAVTILTKPRKSKQLRRVMWWTRKIMEAPELSEDEEVNVSFHSDELEVDDIEKTPSRARHIYNIICGISIEPNGKQSAEEKEFIFRSKTNISEVGLWRRVCNINAIIAIALISFLIGFYA